MYRVFKYGQRGKIGAGKERHLSDEIRTAFAANDALLRVCH
jgi:hypothetical protein